MIPPSTGDVLAGIRTAREADQEHRLDELLEQCCPGHGSMAHVRGCINHPEADQ